MDRTNLIMVYLDYKAVKKNYNHIQNMTVEKGVLKDGVQYDITFVKFKPSNIKYRFIYTYAHITKV